MHFAKYFSTGQLPFFVVMGCRPLPHCFREIRIVVTDCGSESVQIIFGVARNALPPLFCLAKSAFLKAFATVVSVQCGRNRGGIDAAHQFTDQLLLTLQCAVRTD